MCPKDGHMVLPLVLPRLPPFGRYAFTWEKNQNVIRFYGGAQSAEVSLCTEAGLNNMYTLVCNAVVGCIGQTGKKMR